MSQWSESEIKSAINSVCGRAAEDADFNKLALSNPKAAVKEVTGKEVPDNFTLRFVGNEGADMTVVLPDAAAADGALSDSELESVAGGRCKFSSISVGYCG